MNVRDTYRERILPESSRRHSRDVLNLHVRAIVDERRRLPTGLSSQKEKSVQSYN